MAAATIFSDFGAQENKVSHCFHLFLIYLPGRVGLDTMKLVFFFRLQLSFIWQAKESIPSRHDGWSTQRRGLNPSWLPPFIRLSPSHFEPALCKLG